MSMTLPLAEPQYIKDEQGNYTYAILPINEYNDMVNIVKRYQEEYEEDLTEEDLKKIAIAREQSKLGLGVKSEEVHRKAREIIEKWK